MDDYEPSEEFRDLKYSFWYFDIFLSSKYSVSIIKNAVTIPNYPTEFDQDFH